jgi:hypothetical protein
MLGDDLCRALENTSPAELAAYLWGQRDHPPATVSRLLAQGDRVRPTVSAALEQALTTGDGSAIFHLAYVLCQFNTAATSGLLLRVLEADFYLFVTLPNQEQVDAFEALHAAIVEVLACFPDDVIRNRVAAIVECHEKVHVRPYAVRLLGVIGGPSAVPILHAALSNGNHESGTQVQQEAERALERMRRYNDE